MSLAATRVLIINNQVNFIVRIKQALEQLSDFQVSPFTSPETALDHLRHTPQDVVLVDLTLPAAPGAEIVRRIRAIQPDIAIIGSPDVPEAAAIVRDMALDGVVDVPCSARDLLPVIQQAIAEHDDSLTDTAAAPAIDSETVTRRMDAPPPDAPPEFAGQSEIPRHDSAAGVDSDRAEQDDVDETLNSVFEQLAAEEPPMPTLEESGTVSDLMSGVGDVDAHDIEQAMMLNSLPASPNAESSEDGEDNTARMILQTALDDSTPLGISLNELLSNIERQFPDDAGGVRPLPSWIRDVERYVREPDFLPTDLPEFEADVDLGDQTTIMHDATAIVGDPGEIDTEQIRSVPPVSVEPPPEAEPDEIDEIDEPLERQPEYDEKTSERAVERADIVPETVGTDSDDPEIAQLALSLTQASLELTAEATLLVRGDEILAYAGNLPIEEIENVPEVFAEDWKRKPGDARIRFVTLPGSGKDYMVYTRQTAQDILLSMLFAGDMPLQIIRRQSDRLVEALGAIPEAVPDERSLLDDLVELEQLAQLEAEAEAAEEALVAAEDSASRIAGSEAEIDVIDDEDFDTPVEGTPVVESAERAAIEPAQQEPVQPTVYSGAKTAFTFLWLIGDPSHPLTEPVAQAIVAELDSQLNAINWDVKALHVYEDYIYLLADVPDDRLTHEIIADLKQRSAQIAYNTDSTLDPATLWADSYFALTPGRELQVEEIQRFINFGHPR
jgi:DNA-binding NarL/FixJ family response regulator/REP element-mobilizing transposase RayT